MQRSPPQGGHIRQRDSPPTTLPAAGGNTLYNRPLDAACAAIGPNSLRGRRPIGPLGNHQSASGSASRRALDPNDRISEILFGLIMVLTFTGSLSVAEAGREDVRVMLIGALGCNLAWGVIDAVLYLMGCLADQGSRLRSLRGARAAADAGAARRIIADALPPLIAGVMKPEELDSLHQRIMQLPEPPARARLGREDWLGALGVFLLVVTATFPVAVPFMFMQDAGAALRVSNLVAIVILFMLGWAFGRVSGYRPWLVGLSMVFLGVALVGMTIALGG
jgi:VIT1/CCC1 family predicted Fe2+/Mn2+ transporter